MAVFSCHTGAGWVFPVASATPDGAVDLLDAGCQIRIRIRIEFHSGKVFTDKTLERNHQHTSIHPLLLIHSLNRIQDLVPSNAVSSHTFPRNPPKGNRPRIWIERIGSFLLFETSQISREHSRPPAAQTLLARRGDTATNPSTSPTIITAHRLDVVSNSPSRRSGHDVSLYRRPEGRVSVTRRPERRRSHAACACAVLGGPF